MATHLDIFTQQLNKTGEELCGDTIKLQRGRERTVVVLSDGLGSGVKANILSTMTAGILLTMLCADAPLDETVKTVIGTLPVCQVRQLAYATFTVASIDNATGRFDVVNFDNPRIVWLKSGKLLVPERQKRKVLDRDVATFSGQLEQGDFLAIFSDGAMHAGLGTLMNLGWGWENIAKYIEESARLSGGTARAIVGRTMQKIQQLYGGKIGDDTSMVGILARDLRRLVLFSGPPLNRDDDRKVFERFMSLPGRRIVSGGTTGNIVARFLDEEPEIVISSMRPNMPPYAKLRDIDLVTEGLLTLNAAAELTRKAIAGHPLPNDENGAVLLARELLSADHIHLIVGQRVNDFYQNPDLPPNLSLRRGLMNELVGILREAGKEVVVETC